MAAQDVRVFLWKTTYKFRIIEFQYNNNIYLVVLQENISAYFNV